jgi:hypothetical protein
MGVCRRSSILNRVKRGDRLWLMVNLQSKVVIIQSSNGMARSIGNLDVEQNSVMRSVSRFTLGLGSGNELGTCCVLI